VSKIQDAFNTLMWEHFFHVGFVESADQAVKQEDQSIPE